MSTGTAVAREVDLNAAVVNTAGLRSALKAGWKTITGSLPGHMSEERFFNLVLGQAVKDSGVFKCTGLSILNALQQAASLGLEINAATGEAYLVPYRDNHSGKTVATLLPGYKGLAKLALQSPQVLAVSARLVYKGEHYKVWYGTRDEIEHEPNFDIERSEKTLIAAYAIAKMQGGVVQFEPMTRKQLDVIRTKALAKTKNTGPWVTDPEEMYRKTPFRRLAKYLPLTPQLAEAIELADRYETGEAFVVPRGKRSAKADELNRATATIAPFEDCPTAEGERCFVQDGRLVHHPDCPHYSDEDADANP